MKIEILCQQHYGEYGGDSYEARVYFEETADTYACAQTVIAALCRKLDEYDSIHGNYFEIYIDAEYSGYYIKSLHQIHLKESLKYYILADMLRMKIITFDEFRSALKV